VNAIAPPSLTALWISSIRRAARPKKKLPWRVTRRPTGGKEGEEHGYAADEQRRRP